MSDLINITYLGHPISSGSHPWYNHNNAFDGYDDSWWESDRSSDIYPVWLGYRWTDLQFKVIHYRLLVGGTKRPVDWVLQGSDDGYEWLDLDTRTNQTGDRKEWIQFDLNNNQYYHYYRIRITKSSPADEAVRI